MADKLLREDAAKKAGMSGRNVADVLRDEGILDARAQRLISEREIPLSKFTRYRKGRTEQEDD